MGWTRVPNWVIAAAFLVGGAAIGVLVSGQTGRLLGKLSSTLSTYTAQAPAPAPAASVAEERAAARISEPQPVRAGATIPAPTRARSDRVGAAGNSYSGGGLATHADSTPVARASDQPYSEASEAGASALAQSYNGGYATAASGGHSAQQVAGTDLGGGGAGTAGAYGVPRSFSGGGTGSGSPAAAPGAPVAAGPAPALPSAPQTQPPTHALAPAAPTGAPVPSVPASAPPSARPAAAAPPVTASAPPVAATPPAPTAQAPAAPAPVVVAPPSPAPAGGNPPMPSDPRKFVQTGGNTVIDDRFNVAQMDILGGRLGGHGVIGGTVTIGRDGLLAPGNSPGILTMLNDLNMLGEMEIEIAGRDNSNEGAPQFDFMHVGGTVSFGADATIRFVFYSSYTAQSGHDWLFLTAEKGISGLYNLDYVTEGLSTAFGYEVYEIKTYNVDTKLTKSDLWLRIYSLAQGELEPVGGAHVLYTGNVVPVPSTMALQLLGLVLLLAWGYRAGTARRRLARAPAH